MPFGPTDPRYVSAAAACLKEEWGDAVLLRALGELADERLYRGGELLGFWTAVINHLLKEKGERTFEFAERLPKPKAKRQHSHTNSLEGRQAADPLSIPVTLVNSRWHDAQHD